MQSRDSGSPKAVSNAPPGGSGGGVLGSAGEQAVNMGPGRLVLDTKESKRVRFFQEAVVFEVESLQKAVNGTSSCSAVCVARCLAVATAVKQSLPNVFFFFFFPSRSILNAVWL